MKMTFTPGSVQSREDVARAVGRAVVADQHFEREAGVDRHDLREQPFDRRAFVVDRNENAEGLRAIEQSQVRVHVRSNARCVGFDWPCADCALDVRRWSRRVGVVDAPLFDRRAHEELARTGTTCLIAATFIWHGLRQVGHFSSRIMRRCACDVVAEVDRFRILVLRRCP